MMERDRDVYLEVEFSNEFRIVERIFDNFLDSIFFADFSGSLEVFSLFSTDRRVERPAHGTHVRVNDRYVKVIFQSFQFANDQGSVTVL